MSARSTWGPRQVAPLVLLAALLAPNDLAGRPTEAAPATPLAQATAQPGPGRTAAPATAQPPATVQRAAGRAGRSPTLLGDINDDGIVDIRDYGVWRTNFGQTDCANAADLN